MSDNQEQYINSLKKIKEVEENVQKEIDNHRKEISEKISQLDPDLKNAIASAKTEGEKLVESSIEQSRKRLLLKPKNNRRSKDQSWKYLFSNYASKY